MKRKKFRHGKARVRRTNGEAKANVRQGGIPMGGQGEKLMQTNKSTQQAGFSAG